MVSWCPLLCQNLHPPHRLPAASHSRYGGMIVGSYHLTGLADRAALWDGVQGQRTSRDGSHVSSVCLQRAELLQCKGTFCSFKPWIVLQALGFPLGGGKVFKIKKLFCTGTLSCAAHLCHSCVVRWHCVVHSLAWVPFICMGHSAQGSGNWKDWKK